MERKECEKAIYQKLQEIVEIYNEYNPKGKYISLSSIYDENDGGRSFSFNNQYWDEDADMGIQFFRMVYDE